MFIFLVTFFSRFLWGKKRAKYFELGKKFCGRAQISEKAKCEDGRKNLRNFRRSKNWTKKLQFWNLFCAKASFCVVFFSFSESSYVYTLGLFLFWNSKEGSCLSWKQLTLQYTHKSVNLTIDVVCNLVWCDIYWKLVRLNPNFKFSKQNQFRRQQVV